MPECVFCGEDRAEHEFEDGLRCVFCVEEQDEDDEPDLPGPFNDGFVHVCDRECETCIFQPGNRMDLNSGRVRGMVDDAKANDSAITCHGTIWWEGSEQLAVCRGFWDRYRQDSAALRLAELCDRVRFITPPKPPSGMRYQRQEETHE